jgi:hypothetical protein
VCRAKGQLGVKAVPDRGPTLARAPQPLAQPKQGIVRGPLKSFRVDANAGILHRDDDLIDLVLFR